MTYQIIVVVGERFYSCSFYSLYVYVKLYTLFVIFTGDLLCKTAYPLDNIQKWIKFESKIKCIDDPLFFPGNQPIMTFLYS